MNIIDIYTDGSCNPQYKIGGWAALIFNNGEKTGTWKVFSEEGELTDTQVYMNPGEVRTDSISIKN